MTTPLKSIIISISKQTNIKYNTKGAVDMSRVYGYCRISTRQQSMERQIRNIKSEHEEAIIVTEVYTGTKLQERPEWNKLYKLVKQEAAKGKSITIIFDSVSRMSRNCFLGRMVHLKSHNQLRMQGIDRSACPLQSSLFRYMRR